VNSRAVAEGSVLTTVRAYRYWISYKQEQKKRNSFGQPSFPSRDWGLK
jgi:hypothetical protein